LKRRNFDALLKQLNIIIHHQIVIKKNYYANLNGKYENVSSKNSYYLFKYSRCNTKKIKNNANTKTEPYYNKD